MLNAKQELLEITKNTAKVKCASISKGYDDSNDLTKRMILKINHSEEEYQQFLNSLDFEYDDGYGTQELYGIVWLEDGTWLSRREYDGSECWEHHIMPAIPSECS
ncbi:MAG: hypothetical protein MUC49_06065 [Raineya sp.]|jgi:hypothetical protein|nr:hypothetical protein [Raineya sp.]